MLESVRIGWCRRLFMALGLAPTACLLASALYLRSPTHQRRVETQLSQATGLTVAAGAVTHPRPGATRLSDVAWSDPETRLTLGRCNQLEIERVSDAWRIQAADVLVDAAQGVLLAESLGHGLRFAPLASSSKVQWRVQKLTWVRGDEQFKCLDATGSVESSAGQVAAQAQFVREDLPTSPPAQLRIVRDRQSNPPVTRWDLNCSQTPLPGWLVLAGTDEPLRLGGEASFAGYLWASPARSGWEGQLTGKWHAVDLASLLGEQQQRLSGSAEAAINLLRFHAGRVQHFDGVVSAGPGDMEPALVRNLAQELALPVNRQAHERAAGPIAYRQLHAAIMLDDQGLTLRGQCGRPDSNVLVMLDSGPLLGDSKRPAAVAALVRGMSSRSAPWPDSPSAQWLASHVTLSGPSAALDPAPPESAAHAEMSRQPQSPAAASRRR